MRPISSMPPVVEDLAFVVGEEITLRQLENAIRAASGANGVLQLAQRDRLSANKRQILDHGRDTADRAHGRKLPGGAHQRLQPQLGHVDAHAGQVKGGAHARVNLAH
mgnify:CR=1 FL=1